MPRQKRIIGFFLGFVFFLGFSSSRAADPPVTVQVRWDRTIRISNTKPTLLLGASPDMWRKSPLHDKISKALADLGADDVRYAGGGYVYPHFGILELDPPTGTKTSWDFSYVDPVTEDVMNVTKGHPLVLNFSAIPEWMFKTDKPVPYPADPRERSPSRTPCSSPRQSGGDVPSHGCRRGRGRWTAPCKRRAVASAPACRCRTGRRWPRPPAPAAAWQRRSPPRCGPGRGSPPG